VAIDGTVKKNNWTLHEARINGAENDLRSAKQALEMVERRLRETINQLIDETVIARAQVRKSESHLQRLRDTPDPDRPGLAVVD